MRNEWVCPDCGCTYNAADYPDYWTNGCEAFSFECKCGTDLEITIEWEPYFYVETEKTK